MNLENFNKAFENKARLRIMSALLVNDALSFNELKDLLDMTDGNLATHLKAIEKEEYIAVMKEFVDRKPKTTYQVTDLGRMAFLEHLKSIEKLILNTK